MVDKVFLGPENKVCAECGERFYRDKRCTWKHWGRAKFCSRECSRIENVKVTSLQHLTLQEQFDRFVIRQDGCWGWRGATNKKKGGYAVMSWKKRQRYGHLVSLELDGRKPPKGMMGCHHCDNPICTNPAHLYVATQKKNMEDAVARGRARKGVECHSAKLNEQIVLEIRISEAPNSVWGKLLSVSPGTIAHVRRRSTWKHVP